MSATRVLTRRSFFLSGNGRLDRQCFNGAAYDFSDTRAFLTSHTLEYSALRIGHPYGNLAKRISREFTVPKIKFIYSETYDFTDRFKISLPAQRLDLSDKGIGQIKCER